MNFQLFHFNFLNAATRKLKITPVAHVRLVWDSTATRKGGSDVKSCHKKLTTVHFHMEFSCPEFFNMLDT